MSECPHSSQLERRNNITQATQNYLDYPEYAAEITQDLRDGLTKYYGNTQLHPVNQQFLIMRGLRQATTSSMAFMTDVTAMARAAHMLEQTGEIGLPVDTRRWTYVSRDQRQEYGVLDGYMSRHYALAARSAAACMADMKTNEYRPLHDARSEVFREYCSARYQWQQLRNPHAPMPYLDPEANWYAMVAENAALALGVIAQNNSAYVEAHEGVLPDELTASVLRNTSRLSYSTTINRAANAKVAVHARLRKLEDWLTEDATQNGPEQHMLSYEQGGEVVSWTHPVVRNGSWDNPQFCPANIALTVPKRLDGSGVARLNDTVQEITGIDVGLRPDEAFTSAKSLLAIGAFVARDTIDPVILGRQ